MKNKNTISYSPEVEKALKKYNTAIDSALDAVKKLEAITVTAHLAEYFWKSSQQTARVIQEDYLVAA
jgi:hypothetical protein